MAFSSRDVSLIRGMVARGDKQHDIAAWFGENQARIVEADKGQHGQHPAAPAAELPPKGAPGPKGRRVVSKVKQAIKALEGSDAATAKATLEAALADFYKNEA